MTNHPDLLWKWVRPLWCVDRNWSSNHPRFQSCWGSQSSFETLALICVVQKNVRNQFPESQAQPGPVEMCCWMNPSTEQISPNSGLDVYRLIILRLVRLNVVRFLYDSDFQSHVFPVVLITSHKPAIGGGGCFCTIRLWINLKSTRYSKGSSYKSRFCSNHI